jgi:hypothetical protein
MDIKSFDEILQGMIGQIVTVINPQCYTPTLAGYRINSEAYKAKILACDNGILRLMIDYLNNPHKNTHERACQYIPVEQIKRVMISKSERLVNL